MASNAVAVHDGSVAMQVFGDEYAAIKNGIAQNLTDAELDYLASVSRSMGLSVLRKQIYGTKRKSKVNGQWVESVVIQVGIDGYRVIAERTGRYGGQIGPFWCGPDGQWSDVWLADDPPMAAKVAVIRKDFTEPLWAVATFHSYAAMYEGKPSGLWAKMPEVMLAKCAESLALRKAFPDEMAGTYTEEEMQQADNAPRQPSPVTPLREVRHPSTPLTPERAAPLSAPRLKASVQPNGAEETRRRFAEMGAQRGIPLTEDMTGDEMATVIDVALHGIGLGFRVQRGEDGTVTARALHNALVALPPRAVDEETGEVQEGDDFAEVDRLVDAGLAAQAAARGE
jgi:phage recombination protein Bet